MIHSFDRLEDTVRCGYEKAREVIAEGGKLAQEELKA